MTRIQIVCTVAALTAVMSGCARFERAPMKGRLTLAKSGASEFAIVVADDASPSTRHGAEELQRYLKEMTGAEMPVRSDAEPMGAHEIILGDNAHLKQLDAQIDFGKLGDEGYAIRSVGPHLVIAGGALRGTMYGVYGLLEDHLGCRWLTPEVSHIPKRDCLALPPIDEAVVPVLEYREPFTIDCFDGDWCARNRMNSSAAHLDEKHGGKVRFGAGMFVHTFNRLVPPEKYFDEHPEYFSEINGERVKERTQLCCTNEDVVRICTEEMRKYMRADPGAFVFSLSQNDWANYCQCEKCQVLAKAEGSQMAPVLQLVNRVAEALEDEFPGKAIETLAYQWTRKAPKTMRPRPNVIVRLCSIECCFMHPLATCDLTANRAFRRDAEDWARVADRLWVWDYVTSFRHFLVPFPNLRVRDDNIRFFVKNNVTGIFEQDNYRSVNGELSTLGAYMTAKFLWNPEYDEDTAMDEFLDGVYGKAKKPIRKYIDMLHDKVEEENIHEGIWVGPRDANYLTDEVMAKADRLWDKAERAVADDADVLERVKIARLCIEYAWIEHHRDKPYLIDHKHFLVEPEGEFTQRVKAFFEVARRANTTWIDEWSMTLDKYEEGLQDILGQEAKTFAPLQPVRLEQLQPGLTYAYYEGDWTALPDFDALTPAAEGVAPRFTARLGQREEGYGLRFTGYLRVPRSGVYCFYTRSDDGSRLIVGDTVVVDNDGVHTMKEASGMVGLASGLHPITLTFFQGAGAQMLEVTYEGPGIARQPVPRATLYHGGR